MLDAIAGGKTLKKTVTIDKSGVPGVVQQASAAPPNPGSQSAPTGSEGGSGTGFCGEEISGAIVGAGLGDGDAVGVVVGVFDGGC